MGKLYTIEQLNAAYIGDRLRQRLFDRPWALLDWAVNNGSIAEEDRRLREVAYYAGPWPVDLLFPDPVSSVFATDWANRIMGGNRWGCAEQ